MSNLIAALLFLTLQGPPADLSGETDRQLLQRILDSKNSTSHAVLEELGSRKTRSSLQALKSGLAELTANPGLKSACNAFRHCKGEPELERMAIATLYSTALEAHMTRQRMAAAGLSHFPKAGEAELLRIVGRADDPVTRANALDGVLPTLAKRAKKADLKTALEAMRVTLTLTKGECIKALQSFMENGDDKLFKGALEDDRHALPVRRMILEAMEKSKQAGVGEHLLSGLKSKNSSIVHGALLALANKGWTNYGKHLDKLIKSKDETIRRDALVIRAELFGSDPTFVDKLIDQAESPDRIKRSAAAISLAAVKTTDTLKALHLLLADKEASVRFQAMEAAYAARHPSSVLELIKRLEHERGTMKPILVDRLSLLTGENFGSSQQMWSNWWRDNAEGYQCPPLKETKASKAARVNRKAKNTTSASFFGLRILSDRLCFVIDNSGSMNSE
ncbi:MAG: HEAT repeat domain-containing protein, partial [Planctomycetota bacterium]|nr:HEAT repeat domain-containing protein [Planctomycetota bacterium]